MKLRRLPEDFQVEELTGFRCGGGPFTLYRLTKRSLGTPEAIDLISRQWRIPRQRIAYGGLKDRHAVATQHVTIENGPKRGIKRPELDLLYVGQGDRPFAAADIAANRFSLVLRDMSGPDIEQAANALNQVMRNGLPNYFDDQRFGSLGRSGEFVARAWCEGDYERALYLAIADANTHDRPRDRREKQLLREHWGQWERLLREIHSPPLRRVLAALTNNPQDFRVAFSRIRTDLRGLYISAFQSFLWNRCLAVWFRRHCRQEQLVQLSLGPDSVPFFRELDPEQHEQIAALILPLPSSRTKLEPGPVQELMDNVLGEVGLEMRMLRVKYPRDAFFSRGERAALSQPGELAWQAGADEFYEGRQKLWLQFTLDRGAYATILVKRITQVAGR